MAITIEQYWLFHQTMQNLSGLRKDMRNNVVSYKSMLAKGDSVVNVVNIMQQDAMQYLRRIKWIVNLSVADRQKLETAMAAMGFALGELMAQLAELSTSAQTTVDTTMVSVQDIYNRSDTILTEVAEHTLLW